MMKKHAAICVLMLLNVLPACSKPDLGFGFGENLPNPLVKTNNRYAVQSSVCYGSKFTEIKHLSQLPPSVVEMLAGVSDRGGEFNSTDVGGGPHHRFIIGAANRDVALIAVEHGGIGYNTQLWTFVKNGDHWESGPASYLGFSKEVSQNDFLDGVGNTFACKHKIGAEVIKDDWDAANAMRRDAELGDTTAQFSLGLRYANGRGVAKDSVEAEKWFVKAAATNVALQYELAKMYAYGKNLPQNYAGAMKYFRMVANQKDEQFLYLAQYEMGLLYENGRGAPPNKVIATALFQAAHWDFMSERADPGRPVHADQLKASLTPDEVKKADTLYSDMGTEWRNKKSITDTLDYFLAHGRGKLDASEAQQDVMFKPLSAANGLTAEAYYLNRYVDLAKERYLERTAKEDAIAENMMGVLALWTYQQKREDAEAASWFRKSAEHGNRRAMSNLAYMYQQGLGVDMDLKQALYWYGKAADLHENRAMVMLPIVRKATALRGDTPNSLTIPEVLLNEVIPVSCNGSASSALKIAEAQLATMVSHADAYPESLGEMSNRNAGGFSKADVEGELINEYAWAGCFKDASRLLVSYRNTPYYVRDNILSGLVKSLVHLGQYDRALVLAYSGQSESAQEGMLREITVGAALAGNYALAIDYINSLVKSDQFLPNSFYYAMKALVDKGDYAGAVKVGMSGKIRSRLGVEGNLLLAEALYRTNDKAEAVRALRDAQSHLPEYAYGYMMPSNSLISHVSRIQALLEPEDVDASMQSVTQKSNDFRIQVLQTAILASSDQTWRLHWLDEIDQLSIPIVERQKDLRYDDSMFACRGAQSYAFLGMYQRAYDLLQARGCGFNLSRDEQISQDLGDIFRVAAVKNDILSAIKLMPPELGKPEAQYQHHVFPLVYGLVRVGHYSEALDYFRLVEGRMGPGSHPRAEDLLAEIGKKAGKNFPVQDWIDEVNVNSAKLDINRWDALRILFSICARTHGYDTAQSQARKFSGRDLASAEIGIAEGLRGLQIDPTYNFYAFQ